MDTTPRQEHPSTYFVQDRSNQEEMLRLRLQDQMVTTMMGGVLFEQPDPTRFERVLDVGCGTGGWLIETAKAYPTITTLSGVDVSKRMIEYARAQAEEQQVNSRVDFAVMDALRMLEFPDNFFDLVNQRFGIGWLRTWDWRKLLDEYKRVCRPRGVIRITEAQARPETNSPAFNQLFDLGITALFQAGHLFTADAEGSTSQLTHLLELNDIHQIQTRTIHNEYRAGTPEWRDFAEDMERLFRTTAPFLRKWVRLADDHDALMQRALEELHAPTFIAQGTTLTVWGIR